jgi:hypothetical protein
MVPFGHTGGACFSGTAPHKVSLLACMHACMHWLPACMHACIGCLPACMHATRPAQRCADLFRRIERMPADPATNH